MNWLPRSRFPQARPAALASLLIALAIGYWLGIGDFQPVAAVHAAGGTIKVPNAEAPERYVDYPGTEVLAKDEMLDAHMKMYRLEEQDWRKGYWTKVGSLSSLGVPR